MAAISGSIALVPVINRVAGPGSFQLKLKAALERRGYRVHHDPTQADTRAILIIAGTRRLGEILAAKRRGVRIVQRLNGINYVHRRRHLGVKYWLRAEMGNLLLAYTRRFIADQVVYQSNFTRDWWHNWYGSHKAPYTVIHNAVDLQAYSPAGPETRPVDHFRVQVVEGHLNWDNGPALENAHRYARALEKAAGQRVELVIAADVLPALRDSVHGRVPGVWAEYLGVTAREQIPVISRQAHLQYSAEINPSCPNSVIEALACGLPVVGFDSGSLAELVQGDAGRVVAYGSNPWKLETPDIESLAQASLPLLANPQHYRLAARALAEAQFDLETMTEAYLRTLIDGQ
ncbi:MAG: glycosyltransferase [Chloroflexi bacterium]|nr:MAG: glycosyltransferase [Chloroflexota bacterium]